MKTQHARLILTILLEFLALMAASLALVSKWTSSSFKRWPIAAIPHNSLHRS